MYFTYYKNVILKTVHIVRPTKAVTGKAVPLQAWSGPEGSRKLRFPDFMTTTQDGGKVVSLTHRPPLPSGNRPGTHFCWRLSRPQGHSATGRITSLKNSNDHIKVVPYKILHIFLFVQDSKHVSLVLCSLTTSCCQYLLLIDCWNC
jgi:hypothetical protein